MARASSSVFEGGIVYALLPLPDELPEASGATTLAKTVLTRAEEALRIRLRVGIGSAVAPFADVPRSRQEADRVLTVLAAGRHSSRLACIEEVRSQVILLELEDTVVHDPLFRLTSVAAILRHDTEKQTQYAKTLLAYLEAFGDIAVAAGPCTCTRTPSGTAFAGSATCSAWTSRMRTNASCSGSNCDICAELVVQLVSPWGRDVLGFPIPRTLGAATLHTLRPADSEEAVHRPACARVRQRRVRVDGAPADWAPSSPRLRVSRAVIVTT